MAEFDNFSVKGLGRGLSSDRESSRAFTEGDFIPPENFETRV